MLELLEWSLPYLNAHLQSLDNDCVELGMLINLIEEAISREKEGWGEQVRIVPVYGDGEDFRLSLDRIMEGNGG